VPVLAFAVTDYAYPWRDGQAELTWVAGYILGWFTCLSTVTHPSTNWAWCWLTSMVGSNHRLNPPAKLAINFFWWNFPLTVSRNFLCNCHVFCRSLERLKVDQLQTVCRWWSPSLSKWHTEWRLNNRSTVHTLHCTNSRGSSSSHYQAQLPKADNETSKRWPIIIILNLVAHVGYVTTLFHVIISSGHLVLTTSLS